MKLLLQSLAGALIVILISIASTSKNYFLAGLIPLFPAFSLIAYAVIGQKGTMELKSTAIFGMLSLIPYLAFLLSIYFFANKLPLHLNLILSTTIWLIFAIFIYIFWTKTKIYFI